MKETKSMNAMNEMKRKEKGKRIKRMGFEPLFRKTTGACDFCRLIFGNGRLTSGIIGKLENYAPSLFSSQKTDLEGT